MKKEVALLFSGGTESTLILNKYLEEGCVVHALYIRTGYEYEETEIIYAEKTIKYLNNIFNNNIIFKTLDLSSLSPNSLGIVKNQSQNIIPLRRMFLTTVASLYLFQNKIDTLVIGSQNSPEYPDGTTEYINSVENLIRLGLPNDNFKIEKPFFYLKKKDIIEKYHKNNLIKYIFSCVNPVNQKKCDKCYKCIDLKNTIEKLR